jgi:ABC-type cobalamin/Fe3+-siderophores transport system ATPase subunit
MSSTAVVARRLSVGYGSRVVLTGVEAFLKPGGSTALVGSNGSGKSTLLKTFAGLLPVIDGGLEILGKPIGEASHRVAYLSQFHQSGFVLPLRAIDVVRMGRFDQRSRWSRRNREDDVIVRESMEILKVAALADLP